MVLLPFGRQKEQPTIRLVIMVLLVDNTTFGVGIAGQAFDLDGNGDQIQVPDSSQWAFAGDFSISVWSNFRTFAPSSIGNPGNIFIAHDDGGGNQQKWVFGLGGGQLFFHLNGVGGAPFLAQTAFTPDLDQWYNFVVSQKW